MGRKGILKYVLVLALIILVCSVPCTVEAAEPDYIVINITADELEDSTEDISEVVQEYLNEARDNATDEKPYKIVIPAGTYKISTGFRIYSNTYLCLKGVTLDRVSSSGIFLRSGVYTDSVSGYKGYRNITIEGGVLNGNCHLADYKGNNGSFIKMAHCTNVTLKNITMKNGMDLHYVEVAGIDGFTMTGCKIQGLENKSTADNTKKEIEAVQFDVLHDESRMSNFAKYDDTPMKNITITNCTFNNVQKGIGSHSMVVGVYFENVNISNNTFTNMTKDAISIEGYRNVTITGNTINNCGGGIEFKSMHSVEGLEVGDSKVYMPNKASMSKINTDANTVISDNTITVKKTKYQSLPCAIRLFGENIDAATAKYAKIDAGDYYLENVEIKNNTISTPAIGIKLNNSRKCNITDNTITYTGGASSSTNYSVCIYDKSTNTSVANNTINKSGRHGIYVSNACNNTLISKNTVKEAYGTGIRVTGCTSNVKVLNNTISNNAMGGIVYENKSKGTVQDNTISSNKKIGVTIDTGSTVTVKNNKISKCPIDGISIKSKATATITGNSITSSTRYGIDVAPGSKKAVIKNNTITTNGKDGIFFEKGTKGTVEGNTISNCKKNAISIEANANATIKTNTITKAKLDAISIKAKGIATISENTIKNSGRYGIDMAKGSAKVSISYNKISKSGKCDIHALTSTSLSLTKFGPLKVTKKKVAKNYATIKYPSVKGATRYYIYRKAGNGGWKKIGYSTTTSYKDKGFKKGKSYQYKVVPYVKAGKSTIYGVMSNPLTIK